MHLPCRGLQWSVALQGSFPKNVWKRIKLTKRFVKDGEVEKVLIDGSDEYVKWENFRTGDKIVVYHMYLKNKK